MNNKQPNDTFNLSRSIPTEMFQDFAPGSKLTSTLIQTWQTTQNISKCSSTVPTTRSRRSTQKKSSHKAAEDLIEEEKHDKAKEVTG